MSWVFVRIRKKEECRVEQKRIELHCHTNYSKMQATGRIHEYVDYAKKAGVGGIALFWHGLK